MSFEKIKPHISEDKSKIFVTRPYLPPLKEFNTYLQKIWDNQWVTNKGPFHEQFEEKLCNFLGVKYISLFANGTLALLTALQALRISGEVITTPYSFVATTHALHWNGIKPVFADIDPDSLTLDPKNIECAITPETTAIMPVHVYGNPCNTKAIKEIADKYGLKVIYDAAHAFGVNNNGQSLLNEGDLSVLSFHGTKVFNTFEGGAIVCNDEITKKRIDYLKNFGFADEVTVVGPGINGKMNEFQSALGLLQLKYFNHALTLRKDIYNYYKYSLASIPGLDLLNIDNNVNYNYSYFPIFINKDFGMSRDEIYNSLKKKGIWGRRYFYPLISEFPTYRNLSSASIENLKYAHQASNSVICLPLFPDLEMKVVKNIINTIKSLSNVRIKVATQID